jgi:hypothetical protein
MPSMRAANAGVAVVALLVGAVVVQIVTHTCAVSPVAAQAPTIGPTNTAAAETAAVGLTAIAATDAPPTPAPTPPPPPTPVLTPTPLIHPTPTGTPLAVSASRAPAVLSSLGSAAAGTPGPLPTPAGSTGGSSAWPVVGVLIIIAAVVAAGIVGTRIARRRSIGR